MILLLFTFFFIAAFYAFKIDGFNSRYGKLVFLGIGFLLMLFVGFRDSESVNDYKIYVRLFNTPDLTIEPTFVFISFLIKLLFGDNVIFLFLAYALLGIAFKLKAIIQLTPLLFLSLLVYISNFLLIHEMTQIRVGVASGILLLCIKPIYERNYKAFLLLSIAAITFHYSAIVILPLWFINAHKPRKLVLLLTIPVAFMVYLLKINLIVNIPIPYLQDKVVAYQEYQELGLASFNKINIFNSLFLLRIGIYYLLIYKYDFLIKTNKYAIILVKIYAISLFVLPGFSVMPVVAFRISELFGIVEVILVPLIYYLFIPTKYSKLLIFLLCLVVLLMNVFYNKFIS